MVVAKFENATKHGAIEGKTQTHMVDFYNLDMIISVGYRVKSNNGILYKNGKPTIDNNTLTALTLLIAESNTKEKEIIIYLVMNFLND